MIIFRQTRKTGDFSRPRRFEPVIMFFVNDGKRSVYPEAAATIR